MYLQCITISIQNWGRICIFGENLNFTGIVIFTTVFLRKFSDKSSVKIVGIYWLIKFSDKFLVEMVQIKVTVCGRWPGNIFKTIIMTGFVGKIVYFTGDRKCTLEGRKPQLYDFVLLTVAIAIKISICRTMIWKCTWFVFISYPIFSFNFTLYLFRIFVVFGENYIDVWQNSSSIDKNEKLQYLAMLCLFKKALDSEMEHCIIHMSHLQSYIFGLFLKFIKI